MKKEVLISIAGIHYGVSGETETEESDPIEVITPASYYLKNGKHYIVYDEVVEGVPGTVKNKVKITGDTLFEIHRSGLTNTHMIFEKDKIYMTNYETPFGKMLVGVHTRDMRMEITEDDIRVEIFYSLDVNHEPLSECEIRVHVRSVG